MACDLDKCDFSFIVAHLEAQQQAKKDMTSEQKKKAKALPPSPTCELDIGEAHHDSHAHCLMYAG
ncbi:MAG: hypothetical protein SGPRY_012030 [Prymnesium sp.]